VISDKSQGTVARHLW